MKLLGQLIIALIGGAGLKTKDVILQLWETPIRSTPQLLGIVASRKPGDELEVLIQRNGKQRTVSIQLREARALQNA